MADATGRAETQYGQQTPEPSVGPDDARNKADALRRAENTADTSQNHNQDEDALDEPDIIPPTEEQKQAVEAVIKAGRNARQVLGIRNKDEYGSREEEQTEILKAVRKVGMLTHIRYNSHPDAQKAFKSK